VRCVSWPPPTSLSPLRRLDRPKGRERERERASERRRANARFLSVLFPLSFVRSSVVRISRSHTPVLELVPISIIPAAMHRESVLPRYRITMNETVERSDMRTASDQNASSKSQIRPVTIRACRLDGESFAIRFSFPRFGRYSRYLGEIARSKNVKATPPSRSRDVSRTPPHRWGTRPISLLVGLARARGPRRYLAALPFALNSGRM